MHSVYLDSAEILYAIYRDKSDLFDVYCKSSSTKVFFLQLVYVTFWDGTILHCTCMLFICCEINYLVHGHCDHMINYCIDENYYRVIDRLMGIITKTFMHLLFSDILCFTENLILL